MGQARGIMRDIMAEKKVMMWAKKGGIMRDKMADNMIIMLAKVGS